MKLLVRRVCGLGDLLLTLPYLQALREQQGPKTEIHLLAHREHVDLLRALGFLKEGFADERSGWHHLFSPGAVPWQAVCPDPRVYAWIHLFVADVASARLPSALQTRVNGEVKAIPARPTGERQVHASAFYLEHLDRALPMSLARPQPVVLPENSPHRLQGLVQKWNPDRIPILVHPGSGSPKKNWPAARWVQLLEWFAQDPRMQPMLLQGPSDEAQIEEICRRFPPARPLLLHCRPELTGLASLLRQSSMMIGNDSGVAHLAALLGVPTIAVFGPSDPDQWAPLGSRVHVMCRTSECAPCHLKTDESCPYGECGRFPQVSDVRNAVRGLLENGLEPI